MWVAHPGPQLLRAERSNVSCGVVESKLLRFDGLQMRRWESYMRWEQGLWRRGGGVLRGSLGRALVEAPGDVSADGVVVGKAVVE